MPRGSSSSHPEPKNTRCQTVTHSTCPTCKLHAPKNPTRTGCRQRYTVVCPAPVRTTGTVRVERTKQKASTLLVISEPRGHIHARSIIPCPETQQDLRPTHGGCQCLSQCSPLALSDCKLGESGMARCLENPHCRIACCSAWRCANSRQHMRVSHARTQPVPSKAGSTHGTGKCHSQRHVHTSQETDARTHTTSLGYGPVQEHRDCKLHDMIHMHSTRQHASQLSSPTPGTTATD
jgi:hypothetical protein